MAIESPPPSTPAGLEPARQDYPEAVQYTPQPYPLPYSYQPHEPSTATPQPEGLAASSVAPQSTYGGQTATSPASTHAQPFSADGNPLAAPSSKPPFTSRKIFGCSFLVFVLSCIIGLLSAAVIGLAAATGIEAQRANNAQSSLAALDLSLATATSAGPNPTATGSAVVVVIDDGCADDPEGVTGTVYTSFGLLGALEFTRHCNRDAPNPPLLSLFTANFATCMDACAAYTTYLPGLFGNVPNATCEAVSFVPAWTSKVTADAGRAPGNCYLKAGPQNASGLEMPNIGVDCHAAVLIQGG